MRKYYDWIVYGLIIVISFTFLSWSSSYTKTKCEKAGGQLIEVTGKIANSCIYPAKGK